MKESQIHSAFMAWLKKNRLFYIHSTFGKKATMTKDAPDFIILHCGRALLIECKTAQGALTIGQRTSFERIGAESGMVVQIVRSVEQAVSAVQTWLGVENLAYGLPEREKLPSVVDGPKSESATGVSLPALYIANWQQTPWVCQQKLIGEGPDLLIRRATASDLINLPRR